MKSQSVLLLIGIGVAVYLLSQRKREVQTGERGRAIGYTGLERAPSQDAYFRSLPSLGALPPYGVFRGER